MKDTDFSLTPYGDNALLVQFSLPADVKFFSKAVNKRVHGLARDLRDTGNWLDVVAGYDSLLCHFNLAKLSADQAKTDIKAYLASPSGANKEAGKIVEIPVAYGGEYGPDMQAIMTASGLSERAVIELHCAELYDVCMMGFVPGFAFLSQAPEKLHHPRHKTPRQQVSEGSVGIAGWQTGIYGLQSPGGWQIIGRTPLKLFDKTRKTPFMVEAGDKIRFNPISQNSFDELSS